MNDPVQNAINNFPQKTTCEWYPRSKDPPPGIVWATDGTLVWLIYTDGVIPANAYLVRAWTDACVPKPPTELPR